MKTTIEKLKLTYRVMRFLHHGNRIERLNRLVHEGAVASPSIEDKVFSGALSRNIKG